MFITIKSKISKKLCRLFLFFVIILICTTVAFTVCAVISGPKKYIECEKGEYSTELSSQNDALSFASQFSKETEELIYEKMVFIPSDFSGTYEKYNELQKSQGLDLSLYKGEECTLSVFSLKNYTIDNQKAYMTILSKEDTVIGGHISTFESGSRMLSFFGE